MATFDVRTRDDGLIQARFTIARAGNPSFSDALTFTAAEYAQQNDVAMTFAAELRYDAWLAEVAAAKAATEAAVAADVPAEDIFVQGEV